MIVALATVVMAGRRGIAIVVLVGGYVSFLWLASMPDVRRRSERASARPARLARRGYRPVRRVRTRSDSPGTDGRGFSSSRRRPASCQRRTASIARELHDDRTQHSLINVQAATTLHRLDGFLGVVRNGLVAFAVIALLVAVLSASSTRSRSS
jgi:hypothetical protein